MGLLDRAEQREAQPTFRHHARPGHGRDHI